MTVGQPEAAVPHWTPHGAGLGAAAIPAETDRQGEPGPLKDVGYHGGTGWDFPADFGGPLSRRPQVTIEPSLV
jgi:hypothetical protein